MSTASFVVAMILTTKSIITYRSGAYLSPIYAIIIGAAIIVNYISLIGKKQKQGRRQ